MWRRRLHYNKYAVLYFPAEDKIGRVELKNLRRGKWEDGEIVSVNWPGSTDIPEGLVLAKSGTLYVLEQTQNNLEKT